MSPSRGLPQFSSPKLCRTGVTCRDDPRSSAMAPRQPFLDYPGGPVTTDQRHSWPSPRRASRLLPHVTCEFVGYRTISTPPHQQSYWFDRIQTTTLRLNQLTRIFFHERNPHHCKYFGPPSNTSYRFVTTHIKPVVLNIWPTCRPPPTPDKTLDKGSIYPKRGHERKIIRHLLSKLFTSHVYRPVHRKWSQTFANIFVTECLLK